MEMATTAD